MKKIGTILAALFLCTGLVFIYREYSSTHRELLIVGSARSGTQFIAQALRAQGLRFAHERMSKRGLASWDLAAAPDAGRWKTRRGKYQFKHIFHQVRHPLKVISSVYISEDESSWEYILSQTPQISPRDPHLVKCAKYWYYWNLKAEALAEWTYRVEEIEGLWVEFGRRLGRRFNPVVIAKMPKDIHTTGKPRHEFTWEELRRDLDPELFDKIAGLARKYGYEVL